MVTYNRADLARVCCQCNRPLREHRTPSMHCPTGNKQFKGLVADGPKEEERKVS